MKRYIDSLFDSYAIECAMKRIWDEQQLPYFDEHMLLHDMVALVAESTGKTTLLHYAPDIVHAVLLDCETGECCRTQKVLEEALEMDVEQCVG